MAGETFCGLIGSSDVEDASDSHRDRVRKNLIGARVFVLTRPDAVLVLGDACHLPGLKAAVATAAGASAGTVVLADGWILALGSESQCEAHHHTPRRVRRLDHLALGSIGSAFWRIVPCL